MYTMKFKVIIAVVFGQTAAKSTNYIISQACINMHINTRCGTDEEITLRCDMIESAYYFCP